MGLRPRWSRVCLVASLLGGGSGFGGGGAAAPQAAAPAAHVVAPAAARPNIVYILADDLDWEPTAHMPKLRQHFREQGVTFANSLVSFSLCAPSRATILTGQYAHNHGVTSNVFPFRRFRENGHESSNVATRLRAAGYRTGLVGKYMNNYPAGDDRYVPPGWDDWHGLLVDREADFFDYFVNENGEIAFYPDSAESYQTDVLGRKALAFIRRTEANDSQPFFLFLSVLAPHLPARPAPRHRNLFATLQAPRGENFNEDDVSDKPEYLRRRPRLQRDDIEQLDQRFRNRVRSLQALDELLERLVMTLQEAGELENTYLVFHADNGFLMGQHRFPASKDAPYEDSTRVPLLIRGPGVPAGVLLQHLVGNVDLMPTFLEIAGVSVPDSLDGRSLLPLLSAAPPPEEAWRRAFLFETLSIGSPIEVPLYSGVRTPRYVYVEYETRESELYDLVRDPWQLKSEHDSINPSILFELKGLLDEYRNCRGAACRQ